MLSHRSTASLLALALALSLALAACGSSKKSTSTTSAGGQPTTLAVSISDSGKSTKYTAPSSVKGGLVQLQATDKAKAPHGAQLIRILGGHTSKEVLKQISGNSNKVPAWLHAEGGIGGVSPGKNASATLNLPAGRYIVADSGGPGSSGPPGFAQFTVTAGKSGPLPSTPTTVTAANPGKDKYRWDISGALKTGPNTLTFVSKGKTSLHLLGAFRLKGAASKAQIIKGLRSNGKPPSFVDQMTFTSTAVIDGGKSQVTSLAFNTPGKYVLFCPLTDRDGGKEHFREGLLKTVTVK